MNIPQPPIGLQAKLYRLPIWIYRLKLGWIFGKRALLLTHIGRKSGKRRQTVLEIIHLLPEEQQYFVVSGFGSHSQWFQNIQLEPRVTIQVGSKHMTALAQQLKPDQAEIVFLVYTQRNPQVVRMLAKMIGYNVPHTPEGYRAFGRVIPVISFTVQDEEPQAGENEEIHYK
jgi:deazaflavin-dependent oxidoreductase (nitroreductase family)